MNHNLFAAFKLEKIGMFICMTLIILVAALNIISALVMVVMEKGRDIAILKSMGATSGLDHAHLFLPGPGHRPGRHHARRRSAVSASANCCPAINSSNCPPMSIP